jgi:hypothetical protein
MRIESLPASQHGLAFIWLVGLIALALGALILLVFAGDATISRDALADPALAPFRWDRVPVSIA